MTKELEQAIIEGARKYGDDELGLFIAETGWEDWMLEFCESESSQEDGGELSERDCSRINEFLKEVFEKSRKPEEE
ncbi:MAG: hypothetical protein WCQ96_03030 [Patescibacteria group bacterium]